MRQVWAAPRLLFSRREAALLLGISTRSLDYARDYGRIEYVNLGRRRLVHRTELERFAAHGTPGFKLA